LKSSVPQPQDAVAFGVDHPRTTRRSGRRRKFHLHPARNGTEAIDQHHRALAGDHEVRPRPGVFDANLYWKPEQPPPSTLMRSMAPRLFLKIARCGGQPAR